jgi:L-alanine-DL-glutamate epimerase-like enolase superfamily enzyme
MVAGAEGEETLMKITDWTVHTPDRNYHVFLELRTDEGLIGWGACFSQTPQAVGALQWLKRFVMGESPLEVERVTEKLHQLTYWHGRGGAMTHAISAINIALWDLTGKILGQPVSVLLGGRHRERVPVYGSILFHPVDTLLQRIEAMLARNFRAIKLGWDPFGQQSLRDDERLVQTARKAAGDSTELLIDAGGSNPYWTMRLKDALERAKMLADYNVYWFEEPLPPDDIEGYVRLTDLSPVKIAHGEVLTRRQTFVPYFQRRAMDIVQPDSSKVGGLSESRRIAWMAEEHGIELVPHGWNTAVGVAVDIHMVASLHTKSFVEFNVGNVMVEKITSTPFELGDDGCLEVPTGPGLGIEIDTGRLKELHESGYSAPSWTWEEEGQFDAQA